MLVAIGGPSTSALVLLWGSTLGLFGFAARRDGYSTAFSWVGVIVGVAIVVLGTIQYVKPNVVFPGVILYGVGTILSQLWTLGLALAIWRRAT